MKSLKSTMSVAAVISAGVAIAGLAPQEALAHKATKTHTHASTTSTHTYTTAGDARITNLENEVTELRSALSAQKAASSEVETKQQQLETQVAEEAAKEAAKNNLVFFRGGFAQLAQRRGNELLTGSALNGNGTSYNQDGWYVGAGMDFRASDDLFGLTDLVALDAELFFQYQNYGTANNSLVNYASAGTLWVENQVTMFTLAASPKFKFNLLEGNFRPWIAPVGLAIQVVSPPSSGVTVLNPALMLGTGLEYRIWKDIWLGTDFRYQFGGGDLQYSAISTGTGGAVLSSTTTNGLQAGGYIGIGF